MSTLFNENLVSQRAAQVSWVVAPLKTLIQARAFALNKIDLTLTRGQVLGLLFQQYKNTLT